MSRKEIIDNILNKWISRKLVVFIIASVGLFIGNLTSEDWVTVAVVYIGSQTVIDTVKDFYKIKYQRE
jgi:hypothetical protein